MLLTGFFIPIWVGNTMCCPRCCSGSATFKYEGRIGNATEIMILESFNWKISGSIFLFSAKVLNELSQNGVIYPLVFPNVFNYLA